MHHHVVAKRNGRCLRPDGLLPRVKDLDTYGPLLLRMIIVPRVHRGLRT